MPPVLLVQQAELSWVGCCSHSAASRQPAKLILSPLLPLLPQALTEVSLFQRDRLAQQLVARRGYLHKLLEIFRVG